MEEGPSLQKAASAPPRDGEGVADERLPCLSEECISTLEQMASAELDKKSGSQVRLLRGLAAFLDQ